MQRTIILFSILLLPFLVLSQSLEPYQRASALNHLQEINPVWKDLNDNVSPIAFQSDHERIKFHLTKVIERLQSKDTEDLSDVQNRNRALIINYLQQYEDRGLFPINDVLDIRTPIFKDQYETSCAVAYLLEETGERDLVKEIQTNANYELLFDLAATYTGIDTWTEKYGVELEELALIQPSYLPRYRDFSQWGEGGPIEGQVNVMVSNDDESVLYVAGDFTMIDGQEAGGIIGWDGEDWIDIGSGVNGEIVDMVVSGNRVMIIGEFSLIDDPAATNIAYYQDGIWRGLQYGDMDGSVKTIFNLGSRIYVGGDFQKINGKDLKHFAYVSPFHFTNNDEDWANSITDYSSGQPIEIEHYYSTNGPVNDITISDVGLIIGGDFTEVASEVDTTFASKVQVRNLALLIGDEWRPVEGPFDVVDKVDFLGNRLHVTDTVLEDDKLISRIHVLTINQWLLAPYSSFNEQESPRVLGLVEDDGNIFAFGNISYGSDIIAFTLTAGFMMLESGSQQGDEGINFDNVVRAAVPFQDHFYFAGDFIHPSGPFENMVKASRVAGGGSSTDDLSTELSITTTMRDGQMTIKHNKTFGPLSFSLFDIQGRLVDSFALDASGLTIREVHFPAGKYVYQAQNKNRMQAGVIMSF